MIREIKEIGLAKGIKRLLEIARENVEREVSATRGAAGGESNFFARGLSSEGYAAGYRDALDDVLIALNGTLPNRRGWWEKFR